MTLASLILLFVTGERLAELWVARRNTARLLAAGAREHAPEHYPCMVLLHAIWLGGLWVLAWDSSVHAWWLALFVALQGLRFWVLRTLGERWTTRIIVVPGERLVRLGPYRYMRHPNYAVVVGEIAVLPLVFSMPLYALFFSALNAIILSIRIREENRALAPARQAGPAPLLRDES